MTGSTPRARNEWEMFAVFVFSSGRQALQAFHPKGNLYSIHFYMEAAQVQGLGTWLSKMVLEDPALRALFPNIDPDKLVQLILKLCSVHLERSTDPLAPLVGQRTVNYLNRIRGLSDPTDIENWHQFCKTHENKRLPDWYAHKVQYPWLLPGHNESLSSFPKGHWQQSPSHTNLVVSAHVASNKATKINLLPVEAVRKARIFDAQKAASIAAARQTCISINRNNHDQTRMRRAVTRASKRQPYREEHDEIGDSIVEVERDLATFTESKKVAAARLKELESQKKELGRVPRHSTSGRTTQSTSSIPRLVGSADDSENAKLLIQHFFWLKLTIAPFVTRELIAPAPPSEIKVVDDDDDMFPAGISAPTESPSSDLLAPDLEIPISDSTEPLFTFTEQYLAKIFDAMPSFNEPMSLVDPGFLNLFDFSAFETPIATGNSSEESQTFLLPADPLAPPPEWPTLPPVPALSLPTEPDALALPVPQPTRKRRTEVDPADMIEGRRVRKIRAREC
ncbi:hypothetical protein DFH09DRAFT_1081835 [Mycena vulgaris]|nr:hypothetical protein DFH09DRAFT_1081835 [Mycena vulgaris]